MKVLVAVDESEHSERTVRYVGSLLRGIANVSVTLFHVLNPMPRKFLEHGGSENPVVEKQLGTQLREEQEEWYRQEQEAECSILLNARETLRKTGFPTDNVMLRFGHEDDIARNILEEARGGAYDTIVMGRHGVSGKKRMFGGGVTDQLMRDVSGVTVWVVG
jgi:nucleotide-binding universal stress UspA family protein